MSTSTCLACVLFTLFRIPSSLALIHLRIHLLSGLLQTPPVLLPLDVFRFDYCTLDVDLATARGAVWNTAAFSSCTAVSRVPSNCSVSCLTGTVMSRLSQGDLLLVSWFTG